MDFAMLKTTQVPRPLPVSLAPNASRGVAF